MADGEFIRRVCVFPVCCTISRPAAAGEEGLANASPAVQTNVQARVNPSFVRAFSSADDVRQPAHPLADKALDIIAGPKDPESRVDRLRSPSALTTDSKSRVFVADPGAKAVHIFDFIYSKYTLLDKSSERLSAPVSLAVDGQDNVYVGDTLSRTILVYDAAGKFPLPRKAERRRILP